MRQLPDLATALINLNDHNDIRYYRALPDFVKEWAKRDFNAAATWFESSDSAKPIHSDLAAIIEAARVREGSIPDGLADKLGEASDWLTSHILRDLYTASLKLPGDPAEHVQKVLALTPTSQQTSYATAFASNWAQADPLAASEWALSFEDADFSVILLESSLTAFLRYAPEQAKTWESQQTLQDRARISKASVRVMERIKRGPPP